MINLKNKIQNLFRFKRKPLAGVLMALALVGAFVLGGVTKTVTSHQPTLGSEALMGTPARASSTSSTVTMDSNLFVSLAKKVVPSVVNISTFVKVSALPQAPSQGDMFRQFFEEMFRGGQMRPFPGMPGDSGDGDDGAAPRKKRSPKKGKKEITRPYSLGTGFIIESSGLILTNNHVIKDADEIQIKFTEDENEKGTEAEIVGRDPELDLALIKVKTKEKLTPLPLGDSDGLEVGEYVMAVGNPFGQGHSVTHGIISGKGRVAPELPLTRYLQTDAPINPGNSGGPLVNLQGEVIGINNAIDARAQNIGFVIPINSVKSVLPQLKNSGTVSRGYLGVSVQDLTPELAEKFSLPKDLRAPFVAQVVSGEPADKAGIKAYDVITEVNGKPIKNGQDLTAAVTSVPVGEKAKVKVLRSGKEMSFTVKVAKRPGAGSSREDEKKEEKSKPEVEPAVETGMDLEAVTPEIARELGLPEKATGVVVSQVESGGPAEQAGLQRGDLVIEVDRKAVKSVESFFDIVKEKKSYLLRVRRADGRGKEAFTVILLDLKG